MDDEKRRILSQLNGRTQMEAFEAAKDIWEDPDGSLERPLISVLRNGRRPFNRAAAAYAMNQLLKTPRIIRAPERTVMNKSEHPRVRGDAAEALAHGHRERSHGVLLRGLRDPSKDVRFWCAFALGEMAEERAVPILERLAASDMRIIKGFHSVAKEATDSLQKIHVENTGHRRKNGCIFCVRS
jgi:HEAT repeat protein